MNAHATVDFDEPAIAQAVERLSEADRHALPYGAIHVDPNGVIVFYSDAERRLSGYSGSNPLGRGYFTEVAPCLATPAFQGRIEQARAVGRIDIEFGYVGDFDDLDKELRFRIQSASDGGLWIFTQRL